MFKPSLTEKPINEQSRWSQWVIVKLTRSSFTIIESSLLVVIDKVLYEEITTNDDNLESNLLTSSLLNLRSLYKLNWRSVTV